MTFKYQYIINTYNDIECMIISTSPQTMYFYDYHRKKQNDASLQTNDTCKFPLSMLDLEQYQGIRP